MPSRKAIGTGAKRRRKTGPSASGRAGRERGEQVRNEEQDERPGSGEVDRQQDPASATLAARQRRTRTATMSAIRTAATTDPAMSTACSIVGERWTTITLEPHESPHDAACRRRGAGAAARSGRRRRRGDEQAVGPRREPSAREREDERGERDEARLLRIMPTVQTVLSFASPSAARNQR
jgi:hypothetical protein